MPMPAASTSMPMPSHIYDVLTLRYPVCFGDVPADLCGRSAERSGLVFHYIYYVLTLLYPVRCGDVPADL